MVDHDDVDHWVLLGVPGSGWIAAALFVVVLLALAATASWNDDACAKRSCPEGSKPIVASHECVCVVRAEK